jgi:hypothetical protein
LSSGPPLDWARLCGTSSSGGTSCRKGMSRELRVIVQGKKAFFFMTRVLTYRTTIDGGWGWGRPLRAFCSSTWPNKHVSINETSLGCVGSRQVEAKRRCSSKAQVACCLDRVRILDHGFTCYSAPEMKMNAYNPRQRPYKQQTYAVYRFPCSPPKRPLHQKDTSFPVKGQC